MVIKKKSQSLSAAVFTLYCLILIWIVLFKTSLSLDQLKMLSGGRTLNLIPFYYDRDVGSVHFREVFMNVMIFAPFGVYMRVFEVRFFKGILYGALTSLFFEVCQLAFAIGGADVTDLITNTLGTAIGSYLYMGPLWMFGNKKKVDAFVNFCGIVFVTVFILMTALLVISN